MKTPILQQIRELFTRKEKRKRLVGIILIVILLFAGLSVWGYIHYRNIQKQNAASIQKQETPDRIFKVRKGKLIIGVMLSGRVNAKTKHKLAMEAPFGTKLIKVVDENVSVKKGTHVAEYETYDLQLKIDDLRVTLDNRKKDLEIALEELTILKSTNEADIRTAQDNVTSAEDAYSKYWRLEGPRDRDNQKLNVSDALRTQQEAEESLSTLQDTYSNAIYSSEDEEKKANQELATAEQKVQSATTKYNSAVLERKIFKRYTHPNKLKTLRNTLIQARLNLNKVRVSAASKLQQKDNQIFQIKRQIRNYERDLQRHTSYLPMMTLIAPVDGIVTYGDPDRRWGNPEVKVGMDARRKQVIITIPDMSRMIVDVNLPEQYRSKVAVGAPVIVTPDSIQSIKLRGKITHIATLPVNLIPWDQNSPKIYRTVVDFKQYDKRVVSGMSVQTEVVSKILHDVLYIPIEAVFEEGGKLIVFRKTYRGPEKTEITIGDSNNNYVEVTTGLKENELVYLYRPFQTDRKKK